jgi:hypothetical protein
MMLRMEHLFDEVETRCLGMTKPDSEVLQLLSAPKVGPGDAGRVSVCTWVLYVCAVVCCYLLCKMLHNCVLKPPVKRCNCCAVVALTV